MRIVSLILSLIATGVAAWSAYQSNENSKALSFVDLNLRTGTYANGLVETLTLTNGGSGVARIGSFKVAADELQGFDGFEGRVQTLWLQPGVSIRPGSTFELLKFEKRLSESLSTSNSSPDRYLSRLRLEICYCDVRNMGCKVRKYPSRGVAESDVIACDGVSDTKSFREATFKAGVPIYSYEEEEEEEEEE